MVPEFNHDPKLLTCLIELLEERKTDIDSFSLILMVEDLTRAINEKNGQMTASSAVQERARKVSLALMRELLEKKITVAEEYRDLCDIYDLSEENIRRRVEENIRLLECRSNIVLTFGDKV